MDVVLVFYYSVGGIQQKLTPQDQLWIGVSSGNLM